MAEIKELDLEKLLEPLTELIDCAICPRACHANRFSQQLGYCKTTAGFSVSSVCLHRGEEPPISGSKGICNVFFTNCNLQCKYCQNYQISFNHLNHASDLKPLTHLLAQIIEILDTGINSLGFVSPSHHLPQVKVILQSLHTLGRHPTVIFNSNAYDKVNELKKFEGLVDVFLPDYKYHYSHISKSYSDAENYPQVAINAIKEMYRQTGPSLHINKQGYATRGMIIRHLVLPGQVDNSIMVLREIANKISPDVHISLMSQYFPTFHVAGDKLLGRTLRRSEYQKVVDEMRSLGMYNGWIQDLDSYENYRPDFAREHPFE